MKTLVPVRSLLKHYCDCILPSQDCALSSTPRCLLSVMTFYHCFAFPPLTDKQKAHQTPLQSSGSATLATVQCKSHLQTPTLPILHCTSLVSKVRQSSWLRGSSGFEGNRPRMASSASSTASHMETEGVVESHEDRSLYGRYGLALFRAALSKSVSEKVAADLEMLKGCLADSNDFKLFVETPGISAAVKWDVVCAMQEKYKLQEITVNFLKVLLENKRLGQLPKMINAFEAYYRKHKGEIKCIVTSAKPLSASQQKEVIAALQKRAGYSAKLILEFDVKPGIVAGLVVRLGEAVLDFSVHSRVESLKSQLMTSAG